MVVNKKLRRLSTVGSQIGRRPLEIAPAAFFFAKSVEGYVVQIPGEGESQTDIPMPSETG